MGTLSPKVLLLLVTAGMQPEEGWPFSGIGVEESQASGGGQYNIIVRVTTMATIYGELTT